jgi:hypothetical protein
MGIKSEFFDLKKAFENVDEQEQKEWTVFL